MASKPRSINEWIRRYLKEEEPRSKSLIITMFGDSLSPALDSVWLGELIELLAPFDVNEGLVRTSSFRLVEEKWLESQRDSRRVRYGLTSSGVRRFEHAYRRIYAARPDSWDGKWTVVVLSKAGNGAAERSELRHKLGWEGFGMLAPGIFLHPSADVASLGEILDELELRQRAVVLTANDLAGLDARPVTALASECWDLEEVSQLYTGFLDRFEPVVALAADTLTPESAFVLQTLLIHSYRRVSLHDPRLPAPLLPPDWPGHAAYDLCRELYQLTVRGTQKHLKAKLPALSSAAVPAVVLQRFGGLSG